MNKRTNNGFAGVEAVERALTLLDTFNDGSSALSLKELSQRSGLTKSTILRIAVSLGRFGYLVRDREGLYHLGPVLWRLGSLFRQNLNLGVVVRPVLERIAVETGESASFYILRNDYGVCLYRVNSKRLARDHIDEGEIIPLGRGSSGQILKMFSDPRSATPARETVYVSLGERDPEVAGVSAAVLSPEGELVGAVSLSGLLTRFTNRKVSKYRKLMLSAAQEIEQRMGTGTDFMDETPTEATGV